MIARDSTLVDQIGRFYPAALLVLVHFLTPLTLSAQMFQELYSFSNGLDGGEPEGTLIQGKDGDFYGTTTEGGTGGGGTIFRITPGGALTTLVSFDGTNNGSYPYGALLQASDSNFYGVTMYTGYSTSQGTVFKMAPDGTLTTLVWFGNSDGSPNGNLIQGADGNIYGTMEGGTIFRLVPSGTNWQLQALGIPPGGNAIPSGGLFQAANGNFYGVTVESENAPYGTIYEMTPGGAVSTFVTFQQGHNQAVNPIGSLWQATDGSFYGTAQCCGDNGCIFKCTTNGTLTTFPCNYDAGGGLNPVIQANDGNFYGTSVTGNADDPFYPGSMGWMFEMSPAGVYTPLLSFTGQDPPFLGANPLAGLIQGSDGNLYGTCNVGGTNYYGNVFRLIMPGPLLSCFQAGSNLVLSWRTNYVGYTLQSSRDLTNWSNCYGTPFICAGQYLVTNALSARAGFFRLAKAAPPPESQFDYTTNDGAITITDYIGPGGWVVIPSAIDGLPVITIGDFAFSFSSSLTGVTIPNSVSSIGASAFEKCNGLTNVYFQGNAPSADCSVFEGDTNATAYYLPGTTGWSNTFACVVPTALWALPYPVILNTLPGFGVGSNGFGFIISWATNHAVVVEACTNLAKPAWLPLQTNTLSNGVCNFSDPAWASYPSRFYRIRSP